MIESDVRRPDGLTFLGIALAGVAVLGILFALAAFGSAAVADQQAAFFDSMMAEQSEALGDDSVADAMAASQAEIMALAERWRPIELGLALLRLLLGVAMLYALSKVWKAEAGSSALLNKVLMGAIVFALLKLGKDVYQAQAMQPLMAGMMDSMMDEAALADPEAAAFASGIGQLTSAIGIGFGLVAAGIKSAFYLGAILYLRGDTVQGYLAAANDGTMEGYDGDSVADSR